MHAEGKAEVRVGCEKRYSVESEKVSQSQCQEISV